MKEDAGRYTAEATCTDVYIKKKISFVLLNVNVDVTDCQSFTDVTYKTFNDCITSTILFNAIELSNTSELFDITLEDSRTQTSIPVKTNAMIKVAKGEYTLVASSKKCVAQYDKKIEVKNDDNCEKLVTPDGDGINDNFLIEGTGKVKIVNKNGIVVKYEQLPLLWDGTDYKGNIAPAGLYGVLFENGTNFQIKLAK